jgi:hypothetical protein
MSHTTLQTSNISGALVWTRTAGHEDDGAGGRQRQTTQGGTMTTGQEDGVAGREDGGATGTIGA